MASISNITNNRADSFQTTGSITAGTSLTATSGAITATSGNVVITSGNLSVNGATGTDGQVLIGSTSGNCAWASLSAGSNITLTPGSNTLSIAASGGGIAWTAISSDGALAVNTGRFNTKASTLLTATLPATAAAGSVINLQGTVAGSGGWLIAQNSGQNIQLGNKSTTVGTGGSLASTNNSDGVQLVCVVANTTFQVIGAVGNITIV